RAAALPVGASRSMRGSPPDAVAGGDASEVAEPVLVVLSSISAARNFTTVDVLPVPGPPVMTVKERWRALAAAARCGSSRLTPGKRRSRTSLTRAASIDAARGDPPRGVAARASRYTA